MSSVQHLRQFISERLNAAAEEIFLEFEKTIVQYEEEIDRQRKLVEITWKPQRNSHKTEVPQQHVCKVDETVQDDQQLCYQKLDTNLDQEEPEAAPIKEEEEELLTSQEEKLLLKDETDNVSIAAGHEDYIHSDPKLNGDHIPSRTSPVDRHSHLHGSRVKDSARYVDRKPEKRRQTKTNNVEGSSLLESRNTRHTAEKKQYCCKTCGETFKNKISFTVHMRFHKDEKLFSCQTCGKTFYTNSHLLRHIKIHTGEKPYSCQTCGKRFSNTSDCLRHMRIHTGEKPYSCKTCGKCFSQSSAVLRHVRTHTGEKPHSCTTCGRRFSNTSDCLRHMRTHTGEKPYSCQTCGKCYSNKTYLLQHIRNCTGR